MSVRFYGLFMRNKVCLVLYILTLTCSLWAEGHPNIQQFEPLLGGGKIYAGFGLARDMVSHVYDRKLFAPRDYDLAIVGSRLTQREAEAILSKYGKIDRKIQMFKEVLKAGNVFTYHYGFVIILDYKGTQLDFKFFKTLEDAHTRGLFNVEKILFPINDRSIDLIIEDLKDIKNQNRLPNQNEASDPHKGIRATIERLPKTINWAKAQASPLDWIIRGAMIHAKLGSPEFDPTEKEKMKEQIASVRFISSSDHSLIKRAMAHKNSWKVREILNEIGLFKYFPKWKWHEKVKHDVDTWKKTKLYPSCKNILGV